MNLGVYNRSKLHTRKNKTIVRLLKRLIEKGKDFSTLNNEKDEARELIENLKNAKMDWINANQRFEYIGDQGIVDYYTYNIKACQVRYEYYIKLAKEKGVRMDLLDEREAIIN